MKKQTRLKITDEYVYRNRIIIKDNSAFSAFLAENRMNVSLRI